MRHKWLDTVYSDSGAVFVSNPAPRKGETVTIRIRMLENDELTGVFLRIKDFGVEKLIPMQKEKIKNHLIYYKTDLTVNQRQLRYQFYITTTETIYYYTQHRITDYIPDESRDFVLITDYKQPAWMKNSVCYQIMTDRFHNGKPEISVKEREYSYQGHSPVIMKNWTDEPFPYADTHCMDFYGGDLYGIIEKLDYLQELGITVLYLNPIFTAPTMHKYDCIDYCSVDPHFGGDEALAALSVELHKRNMKLILDISINHTSSESKWFNKSNQFYDSSIGAYQNKNAPEREYYFIHANGEYEAWAGVETMPKLNYTSQALRDHIYRASDSILKKWLQPPYSIDGWRFDVADCMARNEIADVYHEVWTELNSELKQINPELLILAEDWTDCSVMFNGKEWDSTMNYFASSRPLREFAGEPDMLTARNPLLREIPTVMTAEQLAQRITQWYASMPCAAANQQFNLINSHDTARFHNNPAMLYEDYKGMIITLFALPGMPSIYYGDEVFLNGRITDIYEGCRYPMDWDRPLKGKKQDIFALYHTMCNLKTSSPALQSGGFKILYAKGAVFSIARFTEDEAVIFIWSVNTQAEAIFFDAGEFGLPEKTISMLTGAVEELKTDGSFVKISLPAHGYAVLKLF
ncbi:MAG: glycoside hydrolase family 13 protein [Treponema sp.]